MRLLYSLAWWLALPLVLARLWWRGRKEPGYRQNLGERLGFYGVHAFDPAVHSIVWIHAVSVGETHAAQPLVTALLDARPDCMILLTHMTPTGRATGKALFTKFAPNVIQSYLPYDLGSMVGRFIRHFSPCLCVLIETEVWPNLIAVCRKYEIPVALVNARLSQRSLVKARRFSMLLNEAARGLTCVGAQSEADAQRLRQLGATNVQVTGSIKFDVTPPQLQLEKGAALREQIGSRPVLLCASTREGEETLILDAFKEIDIQYKDILLVLVPRHPQRFDSVAEDIAHRGLDMRRRSMLDGIALPPRVQVLLGDSMGEMFAYYTACDVAYIGGSLLPLGGQNLIEACAVGKPVLVGPHTFNFSGVSKDAINAGGALRVIDAKEMLTQALRLLQNEPERLKMGRNSQTFVLQHRGATGRTVQLLRSLIAPPVR